MKNKAYTLIEVMVAMLILVVAISALASIYPGILTGINSDKQALKAWEIAKQEIEALQNSSFNSLMNLAYVPGTQTPKINKFTPSVSDPANYSGVYYVEKMKDTTGKVLTDLLKISVVVCYQAGNRIVGEDKNLNQVLNRGEDTNGDQKISSPVTLTTLIRKQS